MKRLIMKSLLNYIGFLVMVGLSIGFVEKIVNFVVNF